MYNLLRVAILNYIGTYSFKSYILNELELILTNIQIKKKISIFITNKNII